MDGLRPLWQRVARSLSQWSRTDRAGTPVRQPSLSSNENTKDDASSPTVEARKSVPVSPELAAWEEDVDERVGGWGVVTTPTGDHMLPSCCAHHVCVCVSVCLCVFHCLSRGVLLRPGLVLPQREVTALSGCATRLLPAVDRLQGCRMSRHL